MTKTNENMVATPKQAAAAKRNSTRYPGLQTQPAAPTATPAPAAKPKGKPKTQQADPAPTAAPKGKGKAAQAAPAPSANGTANRYGTAGNTGIDRTWDLPWSPKKVAVFKALRSLKAYSVDRAASAAKVIESAAANGDSLKDKDVRHYCYHARAGKLVEVVARGPDNPGKGYLFHLTEEGRKVDPDKALRAQQASKGKAE